MADCVDNASTERQLELIRAHPDLAGKAQVAGELTADSTSEQSSAGLDQCSAKEYDMLPGIEYRVSRQIRVSVRDGRQEQLAYRNSRSLRQPARE